VNDATLALLVGFISLLGLAVCWKFRMASFVKGDENPISYWIMMFVLAAIGVGCLAIAFSEF
jgi:hypothetical protein